MYNPNSLGPNTEIFTDDAVCSAALESITRDLDFRLSSEVPNSTFATCGPLYRYQVSQVSIDLITKCLSEEPSLEEQVLELQNDNEELLKSYTSLYESYQQLKGVLVSLSQEQAVDGQKITKLKKRILRLKKRIARLRKS